MPHGHTHAPLGTDETHLRVRVGAATRVRSCERDEFVQSTPHTHDSQRINPLTKDENDDEGIVIKLQSRNFDILVGRDPLTRSQIRIISQKVTRRHGRVETRTFRL